MPSAAYLILRRRAAPSRRTHRVDAPSGRVVEDDAEGEAAAGTQPADAVPHRGAVEAAGAGDRALVDREDHRIALAERHHLGARLHPRPLLDQQKLAAGEVLD